MVVIVDDGHPVAGGIELSVHDIAVAQCCQHSEATICLAIDLEKQNRFVCFVMEELPGPLHVHGRGLVHMGGDGRCG